MIFDRVVPWLFVIPLALTGLGSQAQPTRLRIATKECAKKLLVHPVKVSVTVFDLSKAPKIVEMALDYEVSASHMKDDGPEKARGKYIELRRRVISTKALARAKRLSASGTVFDLPPVRQILIFGFGETESDFRYARRELDLVSASTNDVVLNFSTEEECKNLQ